MAFQKIREGEAFRVLERLGIAVPPFVTVRRGQPLQLFEAERYVVKADAFFNKRAKQGLVKIASPSEVEATVEEMLEKVDRVIVQAFIPHKEEYYLSFKAGKEERILFGPGGTEVEEHWDAIRSLSPEELKSNFPHLWPFYKAFKAGFFSLEMNPIVFDEEKEAWVPLGIVAEVDEGHISTNPELWEGIEIGEPKEGVEKAVEEMDRKSYASLKLTLLNRQGRVWLLVAGGGASVVYLDKAYEMGKGEEVANYGEYSGNPTGEEVYRYTLLLLDEMLKGNGKALVVGGGIANFTDVGRSFRAIAKALRERAEGLRQRGVGVFVRRGGVREEEGLQAIREALEEIGLYHEVYGREQPLPYAMERALLWLEGRA